MRIRQCGRAALRVAFLAAAISAVAGAAQYLYDRHVRILSAWTGFVIPGDFSLRDSLPALSGGLRNLEAFRLKPEGALRTSPDRSLWVADSLSAVSLEYFTDKHPLDSVSLFLWTSHAGLSRKTVRGSREVIWKIPHDPDIRDWVEVVGVYASLPQPLTIRSVDPSVSIFELAEGKSLHVVRGRYRKRGETPVAPDTSYPAPPESGGTQLMAKGNALAIVNAEARPVRFRVIGLRGGRSILSEVPANTVRVYRRLLAGSTGTLLAYTSPGIPFSLFPDLNEPPPSYFILDR